MAQAPLIPAYQPLQYKAYYDLMAMIDENKLIKGVIYSETKISKELGISRTPFRNALLRLVHEGYIEIVPSKGFVLLQFNEREYRNNTMLCSALETYCGVQLALNADATSKAAALSQLEAIVASDAEAKGGAQFTKEFHVELVNSAENKPIMDVFGTAIQKIANRMGENPSKAEETEGRRADCKAILDAILCADALQIYDAVERYYEHCRVSA